MNRKKLLSSAGGIICVAILMSASPAFADLPVTDPISDGILDTLQSAMQKVITEIGTNITNALTDLTNPASVSSLLTAGFSQNANYSKAQIGAQEQIADASNEQNAQFLLSVRDSEIRDQQTASPQQCVALDSGQVVTAAAVQGWRTQQSIESITDQRGEGVPGTPGYYGTGQAMQAAAVLHLQRYCSPLDAEAGMCTQTAQTDADQRASSLYGSGNLVDVDGVNAANDYGSNLIQPIVPASIRMDQLKSVAGEDAATVRRSYNARMSMARSIISYAIALQTPGVTLTQQQQTELTNEGLPASNNGSWLQALALEVNRRLSDATWAAGLQSMPPASVQREIAMEMALNNYIALQQFRTSLMSTTISATQMAISEENQFKPVTDMPSPSMASN